MKANVEAICYTSKTLKDGTNPLMLRITKSRKRKYVAIGLSLNPIYWDFDKNKPKRNCPNKEQIEKLIADKITQYNALIIDLTTDQKEYTAQTLVNTLHNKVASKTVVDFFNTTIEQLQKTNKLGNLAVYKYCRDSILHFTNGCADIPFSDIDIRWLGGFEQWLRDRNCTETTISQLFRTLRSLFNKAIEAGIVKRDYYPFDKFKISKFDTSTRKRAITKEDVKRIIALDLSEEYPSIQLARDLFVFSYFCAGINFADIALLTYADVHNDRVSYIRKKTGKQIELPLTNEAKAIVTQYADKKKGEQDYIFPILDRKTHKTERQRHDRIHKVRTNINRRLRSVGAMIELPNLTTYVARHTFATVLKRSGVNVALISESLGHSDLKTTQIYLDSFENTQIDEAMKHLL